LNGIESVKKNAPVAEIDDQTGEKQTAGPKAEDVVSTRRVGHARRAYLGAAGRSQAAEMSAPSGAATW
jgi:hypothetical protein